MSESNGTATQNRVFPKSNLSALEPGRRNGHASGHQRVQRESRTARWLGLGSRVRRVAIGVAAVMVLVAGIGFAVIAKSDSPAKTPAQFRALSVQTISVEPVSSYQTGRAYTGAVVARRTSQLGFESAGKVTEIYVDEGDSVTAGSALAELDTEHLATKRRQLVARRAQAAAGLAEMIAGPRDEDIAAARARVESLQAQVELLRLQTARHKNLLAEKATSRDEYERYVFGLKARESQLNESNHDLQELLNGTRKEQITAQRAVVDELDAAIADIDVDLRKSTLKAPFAGTIARRLVDDGTVVVAGQPVFRLVEDQVLEAWIGLPVQAAQKLGKDSPQRVKIDGQYFDATVSGRFPEVDRATRTRTIVLRLEDSAAESIVHGQVVRLELDETVEVDGYWLPTTALTKGARGLWSSFVVVEAREKVSGTFSAKHPSGRSGKRYLTPFRESAKHPPSRSGKRYRTPFFRVERRDIELLHTESSRVLVRGTLNSGDRVITSGTHRVVPGQLVRLAK